ncbi:uncharacterized protein KY384_009056 [Bacidia gigantensis]|uniref:uncharacterized protein n=1 Tax=Bacidia gigantensis TaxID=2732470 RepID=UPI001D037D99|nr:uncharacterized protein KY384_009056 [Bacidia gigantensis]KAG8525412.1 hypothetical protein KY384_009056 [Bacidia gigantensis]
MASPTGPPSTSLPQLPVPKTRQSSNTSDTSHIPPRNSTTPRAALRTPSKIGKPTASTTTQPALSPTVPTLSGALVQRSSIKKDESDGNIAVRQSVNIANFPQPPRVGKPGHRSSADTDSVSQGTRGAPQQGQTKLKTKASTGSLGTTYSAGGIPSLLNNNGAGKSISGSALRRGSSGLASLPSRPESPSSSAEDSYSTSATTFEDSDERKHGDDRRRGRDSGSKEAKGNVIVSVRVKPDAGGDKTSGKDFVVDGRQSLISYKGRDAGDYYYDNVFAPYDKNHKVYDASAKRLVRRVMEGYHGTVFAYGMTGTGKTFSMQGTRDSPGVIPLAITDIFSYIRETPSREFLLRVSYLEIYNEKIHDLLSPPTAGGVGAPQQEEIKLREDSKRGVFATPLKEEIVQSPTQLLRVIARGDQCRKTRSTQFNTQSSRSHAVVQIVVESRERTAVSGKGNEKRAALMPGGVRVSTLSMIDLAGSERAADSKERQKEGAHINKSLLTLGTVVSKLSGDKDGGSNVPEKDGKHLPYRDSKLTRLLQPALSGNSLISILCTIQMGSAGSVASASGHIVETLNTLKFAARAKNNIVSHAKKAEEALGAVEGGSRVLLERYQLEILELRKQLDAQRKDQAEKEEVEKKEQEMGLGSDQRHEEQMLEIHLARTALQRRMDDLKRLILSSQSTGVNANGKSLQYGMHSTSPSHHKSESARTIVSLRTSASQSTLGKMTPPLSRNVSLASNYTNHRQGEDLQQSPVSSFDNEEEEDLGDGTASAHSQVRALQSDLADKNRYIATLEKRLLQARRSSQSRASLLFSPTSRSNLSNLEEAAPSHVLADKDAEIADLRARLDDKDRMVNALRAAARNRDNADMSSAPVSPPTTRPSPTSPFKPGREHPSHHESKNSANSTDTTSSSNKSGGLAINTSLAHKSPVSPVALLSPQQKEKEKDSKRKSIDEMTKILDGMIQDRVQTGGLVVGVNGAVKPTHERRKESFGTVPTVGALAAQLRPVSTLDE